MKIQYLGTGAAERVPAIFCHCSVCETARKRQGREYRSQTQMMVNDGELLIDFPGDSYHHLTQFNLDFSDVQHLLISHWHSDHFYGEDLALRMAGYSQGLTQHLTVYGSAEVAKFFQRAFTLEEANDEERITFQILKPYEKYPVGPFMVYPLPAQHGHFQADCFIYAIKDQRNGQSIFYTHDTGKIPVEVLDYLQQEKLFFQLVSLDCTHQASPRASRVHMNLSQNAQLQKEMEARGLVDRQTQFITSHFSHNGGLNHPEMVTAAAAYGFATAYDGLVVKI